MVTSPVTEVPHQSITGTDCGSVTDLTSQSSRACTHVCVGGGSVPFDPPHVGTAHVGSCHHHNTDRPRHQTRPWGCPFPVTPCPLATMTVLHLRDFVLSGMLCKWDHTTCDLLQYAFFSNSHPPGSDTEVCERGPDTIVGLCPTGRLHTCTRGRVLNVACQRVGSNCLPFYFLNNILPSFQRLCSLCKIQRST